MRRSTRAIVALAALLVLTSAATVYFAAAARTADGAARKANSEKAGAENDRKSMALRLIGDFNSAVQEMESMERALAATTLPKPLGTVTRSDWPPGQFDKAGQPMGWVIEFTPDPAASIKVGAVLTVTRVVDGGRWRRLGDVTATRCDKLTAAGSYRYTNLRPDQIGPPKSGDLITP